MAASDEKEQNPSAQPRQAEPGTAEGGFPEPQSADAEDRSGDRDPHHALNHPHPATGSHSTSEPHPSQDPEARDKAEPPERDNLEG